MVIRSPEQRINKNNQYINIRGGTSTIPATYLRMAEDRYSMKITDNIVSVINHFLRPSILGFSSTIMVTPS